MGRCWVGTRVVEEREEEEEEEEEEEGEVEMVYRLFSSKALSASVLRCRIKPSSSLSSLAFASFDSSSSIFLSCLSITFFC